MNDLIRSIIGYAAIIGLIVGGFWFYKTSSKVTVDSNDQYMSVEQFKPGSNYTVDSAIASVKDLAQGDVIAYYPSSEPEIQRIARVVATEGQMVEVNATVVKVDRKTVPAFKVDGRSLVVPEIKVPKGCVWVLADRSTLTKDSMSIGPVPFFNITGKVKY